MMAAGAAAIVGSLLDWVTISEPAGFVGEASEPFTGIEAGDGWYVVVAGSVLVVMSLLLTLRRKSFYGWLGFIDSIVLGVIAIADYRGVTDFASDIARRMDIVGDPDPGVGLVLVAVAALLGVVFSLAGVAASPARNEA